MARKRKIKELRKKLKAYENTGLTPERLYEMDRYYREMCEELNSIKKELPRCRLGERIYWLDRQMKLVMPSEIFEICHQNNVFTYYSGIYAFCEEDIGVDVFFTEAEAQEGLEKMLQEPAEMQPE